MNQINKPKFHQVMAMRWEKDNGDYLAFGMNDAVYFQKSTGKTFTVDYESAGGPVTGYAQGAIVLRWPLEPKWNEGSDLTDSEKNNIKSDFVEAGESIQLLVVNADIGK